jgi:hypothetical protein
VPTVDRQPGDGIANDPALVNLIGHGLGFDQGLINASLGIASDIRDATTDAFVQQANRGLQ